MRKIPRKSLRDKGLSGIFLSLRDKGLSGIFLPLRDKGLSGILLRVGLGRQCYCWRISRTLISFIFCSSLKAATLFSTSLSSDAGL